ncbi:LysR family substrate-binding domain-containing protein [Telmatospirillum siberiense]|nr:LysR family substrate-binding domain-containing protein [Telmatospirillum siberiense]
MGGDLSIGLYTALSAGNLHATLADHHRRFPDVEIHLVDGPRRHLLSDLAAGIIDTVILTTEGAAWNDQTLPLWSERVVVALPDRHPLAAQPLVQWSDLREAHFLFNQREPGPEFEHLLVTKLGYQDGLWITRHDVALDRLLGLVGIGLGATLVGEGATGAAFTGVTYRVVHEESRPTRINFIACWRLANSNPTLASFLAMLRERYPDLADPSAPADT